MVALPSDWKSLGDPSSQSTESGNAFEAGTSPAAIGGVLSNAPAALYPECALSNADPLPGADWAKGYGDGNSGVETRWAHQPAEQSVRAACGLKLQDAITNAANLPTDFPGLTLPTHVELPVSVVEAASARINQQAEGYVPGSRHDLPIDPITTIEATAILRATGWPEAWIADILTIGACESSGGERDADGPLFHPGETGDGGNSLGWLQLWSGWFPAAGEDVERWFDPVVNARVGLYVRQVRGKFGGNGGWSCAGLNGVY